MNRKEFYDIYQEIIEEELSWDGITNESVERIFYDEMNWNNGDITSGQYVLSKEDIEDLLEDMWKFLCEDPERCSECASRNVEQITEGEARPYGMGTVTEIMVVGHICNDCGCREDF